MKNVLEERENKARGKIESYYLRLKRNVIYTTFEGIEDINWYWSTQEVQMFDEMWFDDKPLTDIAKELRRTEIAVFFLSLDRVYEGKIKPREWKIW